MNRKQFLSAAGAGAATAALAGITACAGESEPGAALASAGDSAAPAATDGVIGATGRPIYVPSGKSASAEGLMVWGVIPLQIKVPSAATGGQLFAFEHVGMGKGGPPRHFHYEQDEWFYAIEGEFIAEVGEERFTLRPGDSLFAPRMVPHAWAHVGDQPGTFLLAVQPAGSLEAFFMDNTRMSAPPSPEEVAKSFAAHGMKVVGPPLQVG